MKTSSFQNCLLSLPTGEYFFGNIFIKNKACTFYVYFSSDKILLVKLSGQKLIQVQIHQDWILLQHSVDL